MYSVHQEFDGVRCLQAGIVTLLHGVDLLDSYMGGAFCLSTVCEDFFEDDWGLLGTASGGFLGGCR